MNHHFKTNPSLVQSLGLDDQIDHYSYNSDMPPSQTQMQDESRDYNLQFQQFQNQKKNSSLDKINTSQAKNIEKIVIKSQDYLKQKATTSLLKPKSQRDITQFICFNDRKIILKNKQIEQFIFMKKKEDFRVILSYEILDKVIRRLFFEENGLQIMQINLKSFNMTYTIIEKQDRKVQININNQPIEKLFSYQQINISRHVRPSKNVESKQKKSQQDELEILSPILIDFVYCFEKNKTFVQLKEAISIYYYQFVGRIIFMSYNNFCMIGMNKRICDITDKTIEIYEEKRPLYIDKAFRKINAGILQLGDKFNIITSSVESQIKFQQTMICEKLFKGKLFLKIDQNKIIQRFNGGIVGYFSTSRQRTRSLIILTGMKIQLQNVYLQFTYKNGKEIVIYFFEDEHILDKFIKTILTITRIFNHRLQIIQ